MGNPYPIAIADADSGVVKIAGTATFTDPANQPGGALPAAPLRALLERTTNQSAADGIPTQPLWAVTVDAIGVTFGADASQVQLPAGWYVIGAAIYWDANPNGVRAAAWGFPNSLAGFINAIPDVAVPAATYTVLDQSLNGLVIPPITMHFAAATGSDANLVVNTVQTSGGALNINYANLEVLKLA